MGGTLLSGLCPSLDLVPGLVPSPLLKVAFLPLPWTLGLSRLPPSWLSLPAFLKTLCLLVCVHGRLGAPVGLAMGPRGGAEGCTTCEMLGPPGGRARCCSRLALGCDTQSSLSHSPGGRRGGLGNWCERPLDWAACRDLLGLGQKHCPPPPRSQRKNGSLCPLRSGPLCMPPAPRPTPLTVLGGPWSQGLVGSWGFWGRWGATGRLRGAGAG